MHHPAGSVKLTEMVSSLPSVGKLFSQLIICRNEVSLALAQFVGKTRKMSPSIVECIVLKEMLVYTCMLV